MKELVRRARIGRSRDSEVEMTVVDLRTTESQVEEARRLFVVSKQLLEYYIGRPIDEELIEEDASLEKLKAVDLYLPKSDLRSDVQAAKEFHSLTEQNVVVAQSGLFPSINVTGNSYTQRVGSQSGNDWDVLLTCDVPVFEGTRVIGNIKTAAAQREEAKYQYSKTKRLAELDIKNSYENYKSSLVQELTLLEAKNSGQKNFDLNDIEYRSNLVSNIEVLDSLRRYQEAYMRYNQAHYATRRTYWRFKVAIGEAV